MGHVDVLKGALCILTVEEGESSEWLGNRKQVGSFASTNNQTLAVHVGGGSKYDHMLMIWARLS